MERPDPGRRRHLPSVTFARGAGSPGNYTAAAALADPARQTKALPFILKGRQVAPPAYSFLTQPAVSIL